MKRESTSLCLIAIILSIMNVVIILANTSEWNTMSTTSTSVSLCVIILAISLSKTKDKINNIIEMTENNIDKDK